MRLLECLKDQKILLLDGAMGTQLDKRGLMSRSRNNIDSPEAVLEIHREYCLSTRKTTSSLSIRHL